MSCLEQNHQQNHQQQIVLGVLDSGEKGKDIAQLKQYGILTREGGRKDGRWVITQS